MSVNLRSSVAHFDPVFVNDVDLDDLASFTGMSADTCLRRLRTYSPAELREAWLRADPQTTEEITAFYQTTDLYIWALMQWHTSLAREPYWQSLSYLADRYPPKAGYAKVYDFGCGIGTDALFLAARGYDVTLVDVEGPTLDFARHRFERRGLRGRFFHSQSDLPEPSERFDVAICFDVFEHLPNPLEAARRLVTGVREGGLILQQAAFGDEELNPCHLASGISRFRGLRWHIHLAGLGLRNERDLVYRKVTGLHRVIQLARYRVWGATDLWLVRVAR